MKLRLSLLSITLLICSTALWSDEHHEHFNPSEKLGRVSFPNSCAPAVQKPFERGVALLHSFWYDEAQQQFAEVAAKDPNCAMAYWGQAMSLWHELWSRPTPADLTQGWEWMQKAQALKPKTQRERDYIDALSAFYRDGSKVDHNKRADAYSAAMQKVYERYPDDHEAAAFYALSLLASGPDEDLNLTNERKAIAVLNKLFAAEPDHPGVTHYLIHACDNPHLADQGLAAARRYASVAPSSAHALHMPSHIFARLGLWQEDINSNLASIAASKGQTGMANAHQLHPMDFLEYAYLQVGENSKAKALVDNVAKMQDPGHAGHMGREMGMYYDYARAHFPALYLLETRQWKEALALPAAPELDASDRAITYWAHAVAAGHLRDAAAANQAVEQYDAMVEETRKGEHSYFADGMKTGSDEARAWQAFAEGKNNDAIALIRPVADKQDVLGKGEVELPAREMLADMLLEMNRPQEALVEYEKGLKTDPNRFNGLYGAARAAELAKQPEKARTYYTQLIKNCGTSTERPELSKARTELAAVERPR
jgi:tetratricopeptide (TPR) repeat protein